MTQQNTTKNYLVIGPPLSGKTTLLKNSGYTYNQSKNNWANRKDQVLFIGKKANDTVDSIDGLIITIDISTILYPQEHQNNLTHSGTISTKQ